MREIAFEFVSSSQQKMSNFSSFHLLITFKDDTFKEDSGKLWVEVFVVTYLDASQLPVATVDLTANELEVPYILHCY